MKYLVAKDAYSSIFANSQAIVIRIENFLNICLERSSLTDLSTQTY